MGTTKEIMKQYFHVKIFMGVLLYEYPKYELEHDSINHECFKCDLNGINRNVRFHHDKMYIIEQLHFSILVVVVVLYGFGSLHLFYLPYFFFLFSSVL